MRGQRGVQQPRRHRERGCHHHHRGGRGERGRANPDRGHHRRPVFSSHRRGCDCVQQPGPGADHQRRRQHQCRGRHNRPDLLLGAGGFHRRHRAGNDARPVQRVFIPHRQRFFRRSRRRHGEFLPATRLRLPVVHPPHRLRDRQRRGGLRPSPGPPSYSPPPARARWQSARWPTPTKTRQPPAARPGSPPPSTWSATPVTNNITFDWFIRNGSRPRAATADFSDAAGATLATWPSGSASITALANSATIDWYVIHDELGEEREEYRLTIFNVAAGNDDDGNAFTVNAPPVFRAYIAPSDVTTFTAGGSAEVTETDGGDATYSFSITRSGAAPRRRHRGGLGRAVAHRLGRGI